MQQRRCQAGLVPALAHQSGALEAAGIRVWGWWAGGPKLLRTLVRWQGDPTAGWQATTRTENRLVATRTGHARRDALPPTVLTALAAPAAPGRALAHLWAGLRWCAAWEGWQPVLERHRSGACAGGAAWLGPRCNWLLAVALRWSLMCRRGVTRKCYRAAMGPRADSRSSGHHFATNLFPVEC